MCIWKALPLHVHSEKWGKNRVKFYAKLCKKKFTYQKHPQKNPSGTEKKFRPLIPKTAKNGRATNELSSKKWKFIKNLKLSYSMREWHWGLSLKFLVWTIQTQPERMLEISNQNYGQSKLILAEMIVIT